MTSNQILGWRVIIIACMVIGVVLALSWLVTGRWLFIVPFGVIFFVFGIGLAVMLRRAVRPRRG